MSDAQNVEAFEKALADGDPRALQIRAEFEAIWSAADKAETLQRLHGLTKERPVAPIASAPEHQAVEAVRKLLQERDVAIAAWREGRRFETCATCRHARPVRPDVISETGMRLWCARQLATGLAAPTFDRRVPDDYGCTLHEPID